MSISRSKSIIRVNLLVIMLLSHSIDGMNYVKSLYGHFFKNTPSCEDIVVLTGKQRREEGVVNYLQEKLVDVKVPQKEIIDTPGSSLSCSALATGNNRADLCAYLYLHGEKPLIKVYSTMHKEPVITSSIVDGQELSFSKDDQFLLQKKQGYDLSHFVGAVDVYSMEDKNKHSIHQSFISHVRWNKALGKNLLAIISAEAKNYSKHAVHVYEIQPANVIKVSEFDHDSMVSAWACRWHPIQNILQIACNNEQATAALVRASSGNTVASIKMVQKNVNDSCFDADGTRLAISAETIGSTLRDSIVALYDVKTAQEQQKIIVKDSSLLVGLSEYGILVHSKKEGGISLYDVRSGGRARYFEGPHGFGYRDLSNAKISPDGQKLLLATPDAIKIITVPYGNVLTELMRDSNDTALLHPVWNADSTQIVYVAQGIQQHRIEKYSIQAPCSYNVNM